MVVQGRRLVWAAAITLWLAPAAGLAEGAGGSCSGRQWLASWAASPTDAAPGVTFAGQTVRMTLAPSIGGKKVRLTLTNRFGDAPLLVDRVLVGLQRSGPSLVRGSSRPLSFDGETSVSVGPGMEATSDPRRIDVDARRRLSITVQISARSTAEVTRHYVAMQPAYVGRGAPGTAGDESGAPFISSEAGSSWFAISRLDVRAPRSTGGVVAFGDSITDGLQASGAGGGGAATGFDRDKRYPDFLARRLADRPGGAVGFSVANAGISGNSLLSGFFPQFGPPALTRVRPDVIRSPGVTDVIVLHGRNDLGISRAKAVITGLEQVIRRLRSHELNVLIGVLTPSGEAGTTPQSELLEARRRRVNAWIRRQSLVDVIDFDRALRSDAHPNRLKPRYDSGDGLHPSSAGYAEMARQVPLSELVGPSCGRAAPAPR